MCGIAGILTARENRELGHALQRMVKALAHRGPDDQHAVTLQAGAWTLGLGSTRLAILDLSPSGRQPMSDESGRWVVHNGEIYNYRELRKLLGDAGEGWKSNTDTEVVLKGYGRWGRGCFERFRGMFGLGLWDDEANRLILARDPFGIKPLYYYGDGDLFVFASEVRALLASGLVSPRLSPEGLASFLSFGSIETPLTIIQDVQSLPPGHLLIAEPNDRGIGITVERYGEPLLAPQSRLFADRRESATALRAVLEDSVRAHLVSDVPVGAFLSGGIDSSAVVALMSRASVEKPRTFSVVVPEREFCEASYARRMAEQCGAEHTEIPLSEGDLLAVLPDSLLAMDQPTTDGINSYVISRAVREAGIKVALSGLGGDELFGGYPSFRRALSAYWLRAVPRPVRQGLARIACRTLPNSSRITKAIEILSSGATPLDIYSASRRLFWPADFKALCPGFQQEPPTAHLPAVPVDADPFLAISLLEMGHYMANTLLRDTDCMSMAHGLEVRVPFVDWEVVKTVLSIPSAHKLDGRRPKPLLLDAIGDMLPEEIWRRRKMGFTLPFERWMRSRLSAEIETVLSEGKLVKASGLEPCAVLEVWKRFQRSPRQVGWSRPWALYVLVQWCELNGVAM